MDDLKHYLIDSIASLAHSAIFKSKKTQAQGCYEDWPDKSVMNGTNISQCIRMYTVMNPWISKCGGTCL